MTSFATIQVTASCPGHLAANPEVYDGIRVWNPVPAPAAEYAGY